MTKRAAGLLLIMAALIYWKRPEIEQGAQIIVYEVAKVAARGIRNNNPGNIRKNATAWQGLADNQTDSAFFVFAAPEYGIRALSKLLLNYQRLYGLNTVRGIINRYAPPVENNTDSYINSVARSLAIDPDQAIDVRLYIRPLVVSIIKHENGVQPYPAAIVTRGIQMAGVIV